MSARRRARNTAKKTLMDAGKQSSAEAYKNQMIGMKQANGSVWKRVWHSWFHAGSDVKQGRKSIKGHEHEETGWNIYATGDEKESYGTLQTRLEKINFGLKYKLAVPGILLAKRYVRKHYKGVPDYPYNANLVLFDQAFEEAILKWNTEYLSNMNRSGGKMSKAYWKRNATINSSDHLRTFKELSLLLATNDTAYREFLNIFVLELTKKTYAHYSKHKKPTDNKVEVDHLFVSGVTLFDPQYFVFHRCIAAGQKLRLHMSGEPPCCDRAVMCPRCGYLKTKTMNRHSSNVNAQFLIDIVTAEEKANNEATKNHKQTHKVA